MKFLLSCLSIFALLSFLQLSFCDISSNRIDLDTRIVGGETIDISETPYQVALLLFLGGRTHLICGGSIISNNFVLTAGKVD